ncbi:MAG TPA: hypothetical protein VFB31_02775 [Pseudolabrys sp.]|nr:hypothetical protein [Pseudolabrys sp.]
MRPISRMMPRMIASIGGNCHSLIKMRGNFATELHARAIVLMLKLRDQGNEGTACFAP